jgi:hypothetical protein
MKLPVCLVVGHDRDLYLQISGLLKGTLRPQLASYDEASQLIATSRVKIAVVLWSKEAQACAHRLQELGTDVRILVERPKSIFGEKGEKNGFAGEFTRNSINELADNILALIPEQKALSTRKAGCLHLDSLVHSLPQIQGSLEKPDHLSMYLLDSMIAATHAIKGGLFLLTDDAFLLKAERRMKSQILSMSRNTDLVSKLEDRLVGCSVDDPASPRVVKKFLTDLNCTLLLPVFGTHRLTAFFVLALPSALDPESLLVQSILFYAAESFRISSSIKSNELQRSYLDAALKANGEMTLVIDKQGIVRFFRDSQNQIQTRGEIVGQSFTKIVNGELKSALAEAVKGILSPSFISMSGNKFDLQWTKLSNDELMLSFRQAANGTRMVSNWRAWLPLLQTESPLDNLLKKLLEGSSIPRTFAELHKQLGQDYPVGQVAQEDGFDLTLSLAEAEALTLWMLFIGTLKSAKIKYLGYRDKNGRRLSIDVEGVACDHTPLQNRLEEIAHMAASEAKISVSQEQAFLGIRWHLMLSGAGLLPAGKLITNGSEKAIRSRSTPYPNYRTGKAVTGASQPSKATLETPQAP